MVAALLWSARRGDYLPGLALLPAMCALLGLGTSMANPQESRYLLAPYTLVCAAMGGAAAQLIQHLSPRLRAPLIVGALGLAVLPPFGRVLEAQERYADRMATQAWARDLGDFVARLRRPDERVFLDSDTYFPSTALMTRLGLLGTTLEQAPASLEPGLHIMAPRNPLRERLR